MSGHRRQTRIETAKKGIITDEVRKVAASEGVDPEELSRDIAEGRSVITRNIRHGIEPLGIGRGLRTKVNANIGTSRDRMSMEDQKSSSREINRFSRHGAHI
jgi:phosphomethylpyrimidine synthase